MTPLISTVTIERPNEIRLCRRMCGGGFAPPTEAQLLKGYAHGPGLAHRFGQGPRPGHSPDLKGTFTAGIATAAHPAAKLKPQLDF